MRSRFENRDSAVDGVVRGPQSAGKAMPTVEPDMEKELSEIRKEVVESRNLVIKTDNLLKNLHAELKVVSKRQEEIFKKGWVGSAVAYVGFMALALGGSILVANARLASSHYEVSTLTKQVDELKGQLGTVNAELAARKTSSDSAGKVYNAIADGQTEQARLKAVDALAALDRTKLSNLESRALDDRARLLKAELANTALEEGRAAFRRNDNKGTAISLKRFLTLAPDSPEATQASFMLGNALHEEHDWVGSIAPLERFVSNAKGQKDADYALLMLAQAYENTGDHAKAMATADRGTREYPGSHFIGDLQHLYSRAKKATADAATPPAPGAAAPTPPPAPAPAPNHN